MPGPDREEVFEKTKEILVDTLGVDEEEIVPEATLVYDLGAESIDFLDISFRVEKEFGVKFPEREIAQLAEVAKNARMETISKILQKEYNVQLSDEEKESLVDLDTKTLIERISGRHKIKLKSDTIEEGIQVVSKRIVDHLTGLGFVMSTNEPQRLIEVTVEDNPRSIQEKVARMLTVQSLVDFIVGSQAAQSEG
jgi:acyl carrier protein